MLVITIPDWAIVSILMIGFSFILLTVVFEITTTNYRKRYTQLRTWVLKKYSDYRYRYHARFTVVAGTSVKTIQTEYAERRNWIAQNIENCAATCWSDADDIEANIGTMKSVEPTNFVFQFKRKEDLTLFCLRWTV